MELADGLRDGRGGVGRRGGEQRLRPPPPVDSFSKHFFRGGGGGGGSGSGSGRNIISLTDIRPKRYELRLVMSINEMRADTCIHSKR